MDGWLVGSKDGWMVSWYKEGWMDLTMIGWKNERID